MLENVMLYFEQSASVLSEAYFIFFLAKMPCKILWPCSAHTL